MATVRKQVVTQAPPDQVWDAIRDVGALHTRLVPGFVTATRLEPGARIVTFANGVTVREPIVTLDEPAPPAGVVGRGDRRDALQRLGRGDRRGRRDACRLDRGLPSRRPRGRDRRGDGGRGAGDAGGARPARPDRSMTRTWTARVLTLFPEMFPGPARPFADRPGARRRPLAARDPRHPRRRHRPPPHRRRQPGRRRRRHGAARRHRRRRRSTPPRPDWPALYLSPRGGRFDQARARALAAGPGVTLLCGRFEGIDERVLEARGVEEVSARGLRAHRRRDRGDGLDRRQRSAYTPRPRQRRVDGGGVVLVRPLGVSALYAPDRLGGPCDPRGSPLGPPRPDRRLATLRGGEADQGTSSRPLAGLPGGKPGKTDPAGEAELSDADTTAATGGPEKDDER